MTNEVDDSVHDPGWPPHQFHPVYESFKDWLDGEAPVTDAAKRHNSPRYRGTPTIRRPRRVVAE